MLSQARLLVSCSLSPWSCLFSNFLFKSFFTMRVRLSLGFCTFSLAGAVFGMVVVGGITRLTRSGLSMVDWRPQGRSMPRNAEEWDAEFERYKQFPEYQRLYAGTGMDVEDFKSIYFWEWSHRMLGRTIGVVFAVPFTYFVARGYLHKPMAARCAFRAVVAVRP